MESITTSFSEKQRFTQYIDSKILAQCDSYTGEITLRLSDKAYMLKVARLALNNYFIGKSLQKKDFISVPSAITDQKAMLFVTYYLSNKLVACCGSNRENLFASILHASEKCLKDKRFSAAKQSGASDITIDMCVLDKGRVLSQEQKKRLIRHIRPGLEAVSIKQEAGSAIYFKNTVWVYSSHVELTDLMEALCKKAKLSPQSYMSSSVQLRVHDAVHFKEKSEEITGERSVQTLYRGMPTVLQSEVSRHAIETRLRLCADFMKNTADDNGLIYSYDPYKGSIQSSAAVAVIRKLASAWVLAQIGNYFNSNSYRRIAKQTVEHILDRCYQITPCGEKGFLNKKGKAHIGDAAFLLLTILELDMDRVFTQLASQIGEFICDQEDKQQGCLYPYYLPSKQYRLADAQIYYPGEALNALMHFYIKTKNIKYLKTVERAFEYYHQLFLTSPKRINMAAWLAKTYSNLFLVTEEQRYADFVFEINDFVEKKQRKQAQCASPDWIGGFSSRGAACSSAVFLESIAEGVAVAKRTGDTQRHQRYSESLLMGLRFLMQSQYTEQNKIPVPHFTQLIGGVRTHCVDLSVRIDNVQHTGAAFLKGLQHVLKKY